MKKGKIIIHSYELWGAENSLHSVKAQPSRVEDRHYGEDCEQYKKGCDEYIGSIFYTEFHIELSFLWLFPLQKFVRKPPTSITQSKRVCPPTRIITTLNLLMFLLMFLSEGILIGIIDASYFNSFFASTTASFIAFSTDTPSRTTLSIALCSDPKIRDHWGP